MFVDDNYASDQNAQTHVFIIKNAFGIIAEVTGHVIVFINNKYVFNQDAKTRVCTVKSFIAIFIKVGGE